MDTRIEGEETADRARSGDPLSGAVEPKPDLGRRLSTRLLGLTMAAIMVAEIFLFVPSIANFRFEWLRSKVETVAVASFASGRGEAANGSLLSPANEEELLRALGAQLIAVNAQGTSRLLATASEVATVDYEVRLWEEGSPQMIAKAFDVLLFGGMRTMRVLGKIGDGSMTGEVVMSEVELRRALVEYSRHLLTISLIIATLAGLLVFLAIDRYLLRPIRSMTLSMTSFADNPEDSGRIIAATSRRDEIGIAERQLAAMQRTLSRTLREQRHLADLGLAVAKINHDLRNTLASAQLVSDRLSDLPDPQVQRFVPTLIRSLDRALAYTRSVLAYGRAVEERPVKREVRLRALVDEVFDAVGPLSEGGVDAVNGVPEGFEIAADPDQLHRALANLVRNAAEAFGPPDETSLVRRVRVAASRRADGTVAIAVEDTGPGLSKQARESLFQAFRGSTRSGGTGLGLAIAAEIVRAHGGTIRHVPRTQPGACFEIVLPARA